jgi:hemoglobin
MTTSIAETGASVTEKDIDALVDAFYAKVQHDAVIGPIFNEEVDDWPAHLALLKGFWASMLLGVGKFRGNPLETHLKLPISREHFERWLEQFAEMARSFCLPKRRSCSSTNRIALRRHFSEGWQLERVGLGQCLFAFRVNCAELRRLAASPRWGRREPDHSLQAWAATS